jgi:hypothetical protein
MPLGPFMNENGEEARQVFMQETLSCNHLIEYCLNVNIVYIYFVIQTNTKVSLQLYGKRHITLATNVVYEVT